MDITPVVPKGRQLIQSYGEFRFRIAGVVHEGSVLVFPERTVPWRPHDLDAITLDTLSEVSADILIIGCGASFQAIPDGLREGLSANGVVLEWMDTGAACRTFNVLLAEERDIAAALIAVE